MLNVFGLLRNTPQQISANFTSRVIANGGSLTTTEQNAVLALVTNLQNNGLWDKIKINWKTKKLLTFLPPFAFYVPKVLRAQ